MNTNPYMYLFVREDLSVPQQIVQGSHATFEIGRFTTEDISPNLVLIGVKDVYGLQRIEEMLNEHSIPYHQFYEPDIGEFTAISTTPISGDVRSVFKRFSLL